MHFDASMYVEVYSVTLPPIVRGVRGDRMQSTESLAPGPLIQRRLVVLRSLFCLTIHDKRCFYFILMYLIGVFNSFFFFPSFLFRISATYLRAAASRRACGRSRPSSRSRATCRAETRCWARRTSGTTCSRRWVSVGCSCCLLYRR